MYLNLILGIVFLLIGMCSLVTLAKGNPGSGGRSAGLGGVSVSLADYYSLQNNQAGLVSVQSPAMGTSMENRFLMMETVWMSAGIVLPVKKNVFGISYEQFGYSQFRSFKAGLAFARSFGDRFSAGIQLDYVGISIADGYGRSGGITFEAGLRVVLSDDLIMGIHIDNPFGLNLREAEGVVGRTLFRLGLHYCVTDEIIICLEIEKDLNYQPSIKLGLEYEFFTSGFIRLGYASQPAFSGDQNSSMTSVYSFGFGLQLGKFQLDVASQINTYLGWSPHVSIIYFIKEQKK